MDRKSTQKETTRFLEDFVESEIEKHKENLSKEDHGIRRVGTLGFVQDCKLSEQERQRKFIREEDVIESIWICSCGQHFRDMEEAREHELNSREEDIA